MELANKIISFLHQIEIRTDLPGGIALLNPYGNQEVRRTTKIFYRKYYADPHKRRMILGINPGRFGAGVTGISFTDPIRLATECDIPNSLPRHREISSVFMYKMIEAYGGCEAFYRDYYVTAVCPLGFISEGKNINYYDNKDLARNLRPFIKEAITKQIAFGLLTDRAFCIGEGKNYRYIQQLNDECRFFKNIIPLPHPRFVMQYRYKVMNEYITRYTELLGSS